MIDVHILDDDYTTIHSTTNDDIKLTDMVSVEEINMIPTFSFNIHEKHFASGLIHPYQTRIDITKGGREIFEGRILDYTGQYTEDALTLKSYVAEDALGYLRDSKQKKLSYSGAPSGLFKLLIERHNEMVEPHQRFDIGVCEVDFHRTYLGTDTPTNINLSVGDTATISPTASTIYDGDGRALMMANYVKGVKHRISSIPTSGVNAGRYGLNNFNHGYLEGYVDKKDILEARVVHTQSNTSANQSTGAIANGTKVSIKSTATTYYHSNGTPTPIPSFVITSENIIGGYDSRNNRYLLTHNGVGRGWINAGDIVAGTTVTTDTPPSANYIENERKIEVELSWEDTTWDVITRELLEPFGGEIERVKHEAVNTLNIRSRIGEVSDMTIEIGHNLMSLNEDFSGDIVTRLIPIGQLKKEEPDE